MPATWLIGMNSPTRHFARTSAASVLGWDADTATRVGAPLAGVATGASDASGRLVGDVVAFGGSVTTAPADTQPTSPRARTKSAISFFMAPDCRRHCREDADRPSQVPPHDSRALHPYLTRRLGKFARPL